MTITLNGEPKTVESGLTVAQLAVQMGWTVGRLACEVNGAVIRRADYPSCVLQDGDCLEIVQMIGGG